MDARKGGHGILGGGDWAFKITRGANVDESVQSGLTKTGKLRNRM